MSVQYDRFRRDRYAKSHEQIRDMRMERENFEIRGYYVESGPLFEVRIILFNAAQW